MPNRTGMAFQWSKKNRNGVPVRSGSKRTLVTACIYRYLRVSFFKLFAKHSHRLVDFARRRCGVVCRVSRPRQRLLAQLVLDVIHHQRPRVLGSAHRRAPPAPHLAAAPRRSTIQSDSCLPCPFIWALPAANQRETQRSSHTWAHTTHLQSPYLQSLESTHAVNLKNIAIQVCLNLTTNKQ